ncbi:MAG: SoxR reducing system RseC family protein [Rhodocyclaceae bacterium]|nr:SoxR reducing system RseC family protein [Rhodocyclaceae bacterium]
MIEARAVVVRSDATSVWVKLSDPVAGCGRCNEPGGCGGARIAHAFGRPSDIFRIDNTRGFVPGDAVVVSLRDGAALGAALTSYGIPTAGALLGVIVATWLGGETSAWLGLVAGLLMSYGVMRRVAQRRGWRQQFSLSIRADGAACPHPRVQP